MANRSRQLKLFKPNEMAYGGALMSTRKGRSQPRPLSTKHTLHLVLKSSLAIGELSFTKTKNREVVEKSLNRFAKKYYVSVLRVANVGNHLHLHLRLGKRHLYNAFIRAITGVLAKKILRNNGAKLDRKRFWDYRPFSRIVIGLRAFLGIRDYIAINKLEGLGFDRLKAKWVIRRVENFETSFGFG